MSYIRVRETSRKVRGKPIRRYQAIWTENGKEFRETFDTRDQAQDRLDNVKTLISQGQSPASLRERGKQTFGVLAKSWLESRHDLKPRTRMTYTNILADKIRRHGPEDLSIAATFNHRPVNAITRSEIATWIGKLAEAGKSVSTIRHHYVIVRSVLAQAVADNRITNNPADYVKLPSERTQTHTPGVVDDPSQFLSPSQVQALVDATPWPFDIYIHLAAWSGLRAGEMAGLQIQDIEIPTLATRPATLRVERTVIPTKNGLVYDSPKTKGSRRRVPLTPDTTALLSEYLSQHPRRNEPNAPLFCHISADLTLDWSKLLRHTTFYRIVFKSAIAKANADSEIPVLPTNLNFHALRHTYASLNIHAGIAPLALSRRMGHSRVSTTLNTYSHLFTDDEGVAADMAALAALSQPASPNVVPMRRAR